MAKQKRVRQTMVEQYAKNKNSILKKIFFFLFAGFFVLDFWFVITGRAEITDTRLLHIFYALREDSLTAFFRAITFCGNINVMAGLCLFVVILPGRMKVGLPVVLVTAMGASIQWLLKALIARPRPDMTTWLIEESYFSFPSMHASISMIFWVALLILVGRVLIQQNHPFLAGFLRVLFAAFAVLIGLSRLYLGVHYPSDVFGGWMFAGLLLILFFVFYESLWPYKWRVTFGREKWSAIPRGAEKNRKWRAPKKRARTELLRFPKKTGAWKMGRKES